MKISTHTTAIVLSTSFITLIASAQAQCPAMENLGAGAHRLAFENIEAVVSVPEDCVDQACGVIVDVHGAAMSADMQDTETNMRTLGAAATQRGAPTPYIVIQPVSGRSNSVWKRGDENDVLSVLDCVEGAYAIDPQRRHIGGYSQGAYLTGGAFCVAADRFASFAVIAGGGEVFQACTSGDNARSGKLLYVHGTKDELVPFSLAREFMTYLGIDDIDSAITSGDAAATQGELEVQIKIHQGSNDNFVGGHCLPGGNGFVGCAGDVGFEIGELLLDYYIATEPRAASE